MACEEGAGGDPGVGVGSGVLWVGDETRPGGHPAETCERTGEEVGRLLKALGCDLTEGEQVEEAGGLAGLDGGEAFTGRSEHGLEKAREHVALAETKCHAGQAFGIGVALGGGALGDSGGEGVGVWNGGAQDGSAEEGFGVVAQGESGEELAGFFGVPLAERARQLEADAWGGIVDERGGGGDERWVPFGEDQGVDAEAGLGCGEGSGDR